MDHEVKELIAKKIKDIINCMKQLINETETLHDDIKKIESELGIIKAKLKSTRELYSHAFEKLNRPGVSNNEVYRHISDIESLEWDKLCCETSIDKKVDEEIEYMKKITSLRREVEDLTIKK